MRKEAAAEISKALRLGGNFKIVFVCLLDSGRLRPDDKVTINLVTEAVNLQKNQYGIILNKVPKKTKQRIEENADERTGMFAMLSDGLPGTKHILVNVLENDLIDEENITQPPNPAIKKMLDEMPSVGIENPKDAQSNKYEGILTKMQEQLQALQKDNAALQAKYHETVKKMNQAMQEQVAQAREFQERLDQNNREHNNKIDRLRREQDEKWKAMDKTQKDTMDRQEKVQKLLIDKLEADQKKFEKTIAEEKKAFQAQMKEEKKGTEDDKKRKMQKWLNWENWSREHRCPRILVGLVSSMRPNAHYIWEPGQPGSPALIRTKDFIVRLELSG